MAEAVDISNEDVIKLEGYYDWAVSGQFLNAVLLQIVPGKERTVAKGLLSWNGNLLIFKGLGRYDLIVLDERNDLSTSEKFRDFSHEYILDVNYLCGFKWLSTKINQKKLLRDTKNTIIGICCIKLDRFNVKNLRDEQKVLEKINNKNKPGTVEISIYGGLGWNDLIILAQCDSIKKLTNTIESIRNSLNESDASTFLDTCTIPGIDFSFISQDRLDQLTENVDVTLLVGSSEPTYDLEKYAKTEFGSVATAFGFHDYVITCKEIALGAFLGKILDFRKKKNILYTYSVLLHKDAAEPLKCTKHSSGVIRSQTPEKISEVLEQLEKLNRPREVRLVKHFINLFQTTENDQLTWDLFPFLHGIWIRLSNTIEEILKYENNDEDIDEYRKQISVFHSNMDCLRLAFMQRYSDVPLGNLLGGKSPITEFVGGSSRLIKATEAVPSFLFENIHEKWIGFSILGYCDKFYRMHTGIINIPSNYILEPRRFWGFYHESGHEAYHTWMRNNDSNKKKIEKAIYDYLKEYKKMLKREYSEGNNYSKAEKTELIQRDTFEEEDFINSYSQEIFAEIFSFRFGFWEKWELWKKTVWSYFNNKFGAKVDFLTRTVMLNLCLGPKRIEDIWVDDVPERIDEIFTDLENSTPIIKKSKLNLSSELKAHVKENIGTLLPIALAIRSCIVRFPIESKINKTELAEIYQTLESGNPLKVTKNNNDVTPIAIVNSLMLNSDENYDSNLKLKITALLSLHNYYLSKTHLNKTKK